MENVTSLFGKFGPSWEIYENITKKFNKWGYALDPP
jgi:hypothetical protein